MKFFCCLLFFSFFYIPAYSQNLVEISPKKNIVIANHIIPPLFYVDNGVYRGSNVEISQLLARRMNKTVEYIECPFVRCLAMIQQGKADMMISINKIADRERYLSYLSQPYQTKITPVRLYLSKDSTLSINHYEDLKNLTIGVLRGGTYFPRFDQDQTLNKFETSSHTQLIEMLLKKRIDAFLGNEITTKSRVDETTYKNEMKTAPYLYNNKSDSYIVISKNSPLHSELDEFSSVLNSLLDDGEIEKVLNRY